MHSAKCHSAGCYTECYLNVALLSVMLLSVAQLSVILLNVVVPVSHTSVSNVIKLFITAIQECSNKPECFYL